MEIIRNPDTYVPLFDIETGEYRDECPSTSKKFDMKFKDGLVCCSGNVFNKRSSFLSHMRAKCHKKWIDELVSEEKNPMKKAIDSEKTIRNQQIIIQHQSDEIFRLQSGINKEQPEVYSEVFYIIKERESIRLNEKVFKIGITERTFKKRFDNYPKGSKALLVYSVKDARKIETIVKKLFKKKFELVRGNEYFKGPLSQMIEDVINIIDKHD